MFSNYSTLLGVEWSVSAYYCMSSQCRHVGRISGYLFNAREEAVIHEEAGGASSFINF
jgi:hypothetical protein